MAAFHLIYDDREQVPAPIADIIGVDRFSAVLRRQKSLRDLILTVACATPGVEVAMLEEDRDALLFASDLENAPDDMLVLRLPSGLMPLEDASFADILLRAPFALETTLISPLLNNEAAAILTRADALSILRARDAESRRKILSEIRTRAPRMNGCDFVDLRELGGFLRFMANATQTRHFNATTIQKGIFRKSSSDTAKMRAEHDFFHVAPAPLKRFLLPTFDFAVEEGRASYSMEHMAVPDAALQFVHGAFTPKSFEELLDRFFDYIRLRPGRKVGPERFRAFALDMVWNKVRARLDTLLAAPAGTRLDALLAAGGPRGNLESMRDRAEPLIRRAIEQETADWLVFSHGDPCLSNILYDRRIGLFRLIDPRGASDEEQALAPPLYDLAKLSHSILGNYDFVNNGLYDCVLDDRLGLSLRLDGGGAPSFARQGFIDRLKTEGFDPRAVRAYELSLFLSMLPLHMDSPRKLPAFALIASSIMDELEDGS